MILVVDVDYREGYAVAAGILFDQWESPEPTREQSEFIKHYGEYIPGQFYKRELPCILELLERVEEDLSCIVIDGFVELGADKRDGLGRHLFKALSGEVPVIGVAKKSFTDTPKSAEILRGNSQKPLFVTSAGIDLEQAKSNIESMHGCHRIPTLLKRVDFLCRHAESSESLSHR